MHSNDPAISVHSLSLVSWHLGCIGPSRANHFYEDCRSLLLHADSTNSISSPFFLKRPSAWPEVGFVVGVRVLWLVPRRIRLRKESGFLECTWHGPTTAMNLHHDVNPIRELGLHAARPNIKARRCLLSETVTVALDTIHPTNPLSHNHTASKELPTRTTCSSRI